MLTGDLRPRHFVAIALIVLLSVVGAACGASAGTQTSTSTQAPASGVPLAQVLAAVKSAETTTRLPSTITPSVLEGLANDATSAWTIPGCDPDPDTTTSLTSLAPCTFGAIHYTHTLMVIGDSHASMWYPTFQLMAKRIGWRVIDLTLNNCGPASLHYYFWSESREFSQCDAWQTWRMKEINTIRPSIVVLTGWIGGNTGPKVPLTPAVCEKGIEKTIHEIHSGIRVVVLADMPHISTSGPECLARYPDDIQRCSTTAADAVQSAYNQAEAKAAAATGTSYVDVTPWFCGRVCPDEIAGIDVYVGVYHINHAFAAYLSGVMQTALAPEITKVT